VADPSIRDLAYRGLAATLGGPVDIATMFMRPFGYKTPDQQVVGGSEWISQKMQDMGIVSSARSPLQEFAASMIVPSPDDLYRAAAMAPSMLGALARARGGLTSNIEDATTLAEKIKALGPEFVPKIEQASGGSVYVTVSRYPLKKDGTPMFSRNPMQIEYKARFADHPSYWGSTISSDPVTGNTVETAFDMFLSKLGKSEEPDYAKAFFSPADKYGTVTDSVMRQTISLRGNPVTRKIEESRPFTFFEPK